METKKEAAINYASFTLENSGSNIDNHEPKRFEQGKFYEGHEIPQHPGLIRKEHKLEGAQIGGKKKASETQEGGNHYKDFPIQPAYFCYVNNIPYLEATAIKYLCRHRLKNKKEDLLKAKHFIDLLIEFEYDKEY